MKSLLFFSLVNLNNHVPPAHRGGWRNQSVSSSFQLERDVSGNVRLQLRRIVLPVK